MTCLERTGDLEVKKYRNHKDVDEDASNQMTNDDHGKLSSPRINFCWLACQ